MSEATSDVAVEKATIEAPVDMTAVQQEEAEAKDVTDMQEDAAELHDDGVFGEEEAEELDESGAPKRTAKALDDNWEEGFNKLQKFKAKHGHCAVPSRFPGDPHLGSWVATQRRQYRIMVSGSGLSTPMTEERARRLEAIGFKWSSKDPRHIPWEARMEELTNFVKRYGHAQVPIGWTENVSLANWISTQRQEYKLKLKGRSNRLTEERMQMLNDVGFIWEAQRGGPRRLKKARVSVPARATPKPPSRTRGGRGGADPATMPKSDMQGLASSDAVVSRMQDAANALNGSVPGAGQPTNDATLQLLINQQQALLESQRRNAALLTAMQPQLGMQGMNPMGGMGGAQFGMPGMPGSFLMPQQFAQMPILYTANGMPFQLQPLGSNNPFSPTAGGMPQNIFSNMPMPMLDPSQQMAALPQQATAASDPQNQAALLGTQGATAGGAGAPSPLVAAQQAPAILPKPRPTPPSAPAEPDDKEDEDGYGDEDDEGDD
ncbi:hypothetical protein MPSEU_000246300 [Mayamaea pseudoterrestris]|nr:hypothetical protein MPSEU_000246300 [Mayamaea pseudoterrestris]